MATRKKTKFSRYFILLALLLCTGSGCGLATGLLTQFGTPGSGLRAELGYWQPQVNSTIAVGAGGSNINLTSTLLIPDTDDIIYLTLSGAITTSRLNYNLFFLESSGTAFNIPAVTFNGVSFGGAGRTVSTDFELITHTIVYEYMILPNRTYYIGIRVGFEIFDMNIALQDGPVNQEFNEVTYVPVLGAVINWAPYPGLTIFVELNAVSVDTDSISINIDSEFDGDLFDIWTGVRYRWGQFFLGVGYRKLNIDATIGKSLIGGFDFQGFTLAGGAQF